MSYFIDLKYSDVYDELTVYCEKSDWMYLAGYLCWEYALAGQILQAHATL